MGVAILGPGNIGTDLMMKLQHVDEMELTLLTGIDPASAGLERAAALGVETSSEGVEPILERDDIDIVFDATAAQAHLVNAPRLKSAGKQVIDLTPAAIGPYVVPTVNLEQHLSAPNVNLISCGGQATIPFVHAVDRVADVEYAEIVATIASDSAGPGTRQNIDHFTATTAEGVQVVGGADQAKAIIILNPADPPILMRDTIFARVRKPDERSIEASVEEMSRAIAEYVPGCRLVLCETDGDKVTVMLEIEGAGDFLPAHAGNLDVMTAAAAQVGRRLAAQLTNSEETA